MYYISSSAWRSFVKRVAFYGRSGSLISKAPITIYFYLLEKVLVALILSKFSYFK